MSVIKKFKLVVYVKGIKKYIKEYAFESISFTTDRTKAKVFNNLTIQRKNKETRVDLLSFEKEYIK